LSEKIKNESLPLVTKFRSPNFCVEKFKTKAFPL
jgi:hypothetical protein